MHVRISYFKFVITYFYLICQIIQNCLKMECLLSIIYCRKEFNVTKPNELRNTTMEEDNDQLAFWKNINKPPYTIIMQVFLTIYLNVTLILWGILVFDIASLNFGFLKWLLRTDTVEITDPLILIMLALTGGAIGGIIFGMNKLYKYSNKGSFDIRYAGDYIFRQIGSAALGAIVFALVVSGLMTIGLPTSGQDDTTTSESATLSEAAPTETPGAETAEGEEPINASDETDTTADKKNIDAEPPFSRASGYYVFGLGFLAGFGSYQVIKKLDQIIKVLFGQLRSEDLEEKN